MISLAALGSTIANSRPAQYAIGAGLIVVGFLFWLAQHDRKLLENHNLRSERKARKTQSKIGDQLNEKSTQVADARASAPSGTVAADELPDDIRSILIRD